MRILQKTVFQQIHLHLDCCCYTYKVSHHLSVLQTLPKHLLKRKKFRIFKFWYFSFPDQTSAITLGTDDALVDDGTNVFSSLEICFGLISYQVSLKNVKYVAVILKLL